MIPIIKKKKEWYFVTKIVQTYDEKKKFYLVVEKIFEKKLRLLRTIRIQIVKRLLGFRNMQEKLENIFLATSVFINNSV